MENQERAYVAASRRTDRSLEARYQSALMASKVHKRRTGKSLYITQKIVMEEEMYEEEDQGLPGPWQLSQNYHRSRAMSQTDAYIAALIARKSGMKCGFQEDAALFAPQVPNTVARFEDKSTAPEQPVSQPTQFYLPCNNFAFLPEIHIDPPLEVPKGYEFGLEPSFSSSEVCPDATYHKHLSSRDSSLSDVSAYASNYDQENGLTNPDWSPNSSHLCLEDFLIDPDSKNLPNDA